MNWRLIFKKSGTFVEIYGKKGEVILSRPFHGWVQRMIDEDNQQLKPKIDLRPGENLEQDKNTGDLKIQYVK